MGVREEKGGGVEEEWGREFGGEAEWGLGGPDDGGKRRIVLSKPLNSKGQLRRERGGQARPELGLKIWTRGTDSGGKGLGGGRVSSSGTPAAANPAAAGCLHK